MLTPSIVGARDRDILLRLSIVGGRENVVVQKWSAAALSITPPTHLTRHSVVASFSTATSRSAFQNGSSSVQATRGPLCRGYGGILAASEWWYLAGFQSRGLTCSRL